MALLARQRGRLPPRAPPPHPSPRDARPRPSLLLRPTPSLSGGAQGRNAHVADFLLFHEPGAAPHAELPGAPRPRNVRQIEVRSLRELYRRKIGLNVSLDSGKIKDLKVTNGHVFERHIPPSTYSHWAFGDVDVVYGDLGRFLTGPALAYDVLTFRGEDTCDKRTRTLFAGQLTAFANTPRTRALYRSVPGWERALLAPAFVFLDERLLPAHAMRKQPGDVALLIAQLTDRFGQAAGSRTRVLWAEGRLLLLSGGCVLGEAALLHLNKLKFTHYNRSLAFDPDGFAFDARGGVVPLASGPQEHRDALARLRRGELASCCRGGPR